MEEVRPGLLLGGKMGSLVAARRAILGKVAFGPGGLEYTAHARMMITFPEISVKFRSSEKKSNLRL